MCTATSPQGKKKEENPRKPPHTAVGTFLEPSFHLCVYPQCLKPSYAERTGGDFCSYYIYTKNGIKTAEESSMSDLLLPYTILHLPALPEHLQG